MLRPEIIERYKQIVTESAKLEKQQKELREEVIKLIDESGGWDDCFLQIDEKAIYHEDLIYEWVCSTYPEFKEEVRRETLNWEKFKSLLNLGKIDITLIPNTHIQFVPIKKVITNRRRKRSG